MKDLPLLRSGGKCASDSRYKGETDTAHVATQLNFERLNQYMD